MRYLDHLAFEWASWLIWFANCYESERRARSGLGTEQKHAELRRRRGNWVVTLCVLGLRMLERLSSTKSAVQERHVADRVTFARMAVAEPAVHQSQVAGIGVFQCFRQAHLPLPDDDQPHVHS
jgi:hypothetical protein